MNTTQPTNTKSLAARRVARIAATATVLVSTTSALGIAATAGPSAAAGSCGSTPFGIYTGQGRQRGDGNEAYPVDNYGLGSRDVDVSTSCGAPGGAVWFGVKDTMTGIWYGGWRNSDQNGQLSVSITGIPASSCGHTFLADASDWGEPGAPAAAEQTFIDNCLPEIQIDANGNIFGNEFTPGGQVVLTVDLPPNAGGGTLLAPTTVVATTFHLNRSPTPPTAQGDVSLHATITPGVCVWVTALDVTTEVTVGARGCIG